MFSAKSFFVFVGGCLVARAVLVGRVDYQGGDLGGYLRSLTMSKAPQIGEISGYPEKQSYLYELLRDKYYDQDKIDLAVMEENALKGFVEAVGDPHTEYLTKEENEIFGESMEGTQHFEGIGAVVSKKKEGIMITEVIKGSPAFVAGLQPLDIIIKIEDVSTQEMSLSDAVNKIRGPKGTTVQLSIFRQHDLADEPELFELEVTRGTIDVPSVELEMLPYSGGTAVHLEVSIFGDDTIVKLQEALLQTKEPYQGVILDVRGNGGGYLPTAVDLASFFLPKNEIVTTAKYTISPNEVLKSKGYGTFIGKPVVVLIDGMSASASEIVAGSLQQRSNAIVVGTKSFGKGSIQTIQGIDDGSMLKYTVGKRYLPDGTNVDEVGLVPDVDVEFDRELFVSSGVDLQLQKGLELLSNPTYRTGAGCCGNE